MFVFSVLCCLLIVIVAPLASGQNSLATGPDGRELSPANQRSQIWSSQGGDQFNSRSMLNAKINNVTLSLSLATSSIRVGASTWVTPATDDYRFYVPSEDGKLRAFDKNTKSLVWEKSLFSDYYDEDLVLTGGKTVVISVTTPVFYDRYLLLGVYGPADIIMIRRTDGSFHKRIRIHDHPYAVVSQSGALYGDLYLVGTSSTEKEMASNSEYECCSFGGTFEAINLPHWKKHWKKPFRTISSKMLSAGWSGADVKGIGPSIDEKTGVVYFSTGHAYTNSPEYDTCVALTSELDGSSRETVIGNICNPAWASGALFDSVVGLNIETGTVAVARRFTIHDSWNSGCSSSNGVSMNISNDNCPQFPGSRSGFVTSPMLDYAFFCGNCSEVLSPAAAANIPSGRITKGFCWDGEEGKYSKAERCLKGRWSDPKSENVKDSVRSRMYDRETSAVLYVMQNDGKVWCLKARDLSTLWVDDSLPGSVRTTENLAGEDALRGASFDNDMLYVGVTNEGFSNWTLNNGTTTRCGGWVGFDKISGQRTWTTLNPACRDPTGGPDDPDFLSNGRAYTAGGYGATAAIDGAVLVTSADTAFSPKYDSGSPVSGTGGYLHMLRPSDGGILSSFQTGSSNYGGFSVDFKCAYVGSGYKKDLGFSEGKEIFVFCIKT